MLERQAIEASRSDGKGDDETVGDELGLPPEDLPMEIQDADGAMMEDWGMQEGTQVADLDDLNPEVAVLFALETEGLGEGGGNTEGDSDEPEDEDEPQFEWDQALGDDDEDFGHLALRAVEDARREEMERLFVTYGAFFFVHPASFD
jgi:hypothetical protein